MSDTTPRGICHCANPSCKACQGTCKAPGTKAISIRQDGTPRGEFRFCEPCVKGWKGLEGIDIQPILQPAGGHP